MRIVVACYCDIETGGGGATQARNTAVGLRQRGHKVSLLSHSKKPFSAGDLSGIPVLYHHIESGRTWRIPLLVRERRLARFLRKEMDRPDLFVAISPFYVNAARMAWPDIRIVYLFPCLLSHCLDDFGVRGDSGKGGLSFFNRKLLARSEKCSFFNADITIAHTETSRNEILAFSDVSKRRVLIATPGIDFTSLKVTSSREETRKYLNTPDDAFVVIWVGRLSKNKDPFCLLHSLKNMKNKPFIWFVGVGPLMQEIKDYISSSQWSDKVRLIGFREDIANLLNASDVYMHSATYEAFGLVYLEAMYCGLPVIGPMNEPGVCRSSLQDIVDDGVNGFLYRKSSPQEMPEKVERLLKDSRLLKQMSSFSRSKASEISSVDKYVSKILCSVEAIDRL